MSCPVPVGLGYMLDLQKSTESQKGETACVPDDLVRKSRPFFSCRLPGRVGSDLALGEKPVRDKVSDEPGNQLEILASSKGVGSWVLGVAQLGEALWLLLFVH